MLARLVRILDVLSDPRAADPRWVAAEHAVLARDSGLGTDA
jgi:hypothetical protein